MNDKVRQHLAPWLLTLAQVYGWRVPSLEQQELVNIIEGLTDQAVREQRGAQYDYYVRRGWINTYEVSREDFVVTDVQILAQQAKTEDATD